MPRGRKWITYALFDVQRIHVYRIENDFSARNPSGIERQAGNRDDCRGQLDAILRHRQRLPDPIQDLLLRFFVVVFFHVRFC